MIAKCEGEITALDEKIAGLKDLGETVKRRRAEMKTNLDLLDSIVRDEAISDAHLRMLVERINIREQDGEMQIEIQLKAAFNWHLTALYSNGSSMDLELTA